MFRASSVPIIRSYQLYTWQLVCLCRLCGCWYEEFSLTRVSAGMSSAETGGYVGRYGATVSSGLGRAAPTIKTTRLVRILMYSLWADLCIPGGGFRLTADTFYNAAFLLLPLHFQFVIVFRCSDIIFQAFVAEYCYYVSVCLFGVKAVGLTMDLVEFWDWH